MRLPTQLTKRFRQSFPLRRCELHIAGNPLLELNISGTLGDMKLLS